MKLKLQPFCVFPINFFFYKRKLKIELLQVTSAFVHLSILFFIVYQPGVSFSPNILFLLLQSKFQ